MKYLHLYDKQTDYDSVKNTLILPSASLIEKNNHVEYNPHQYVEIAGIKWATMNVGAKSITDYGLYFQWGDTQGYTYDKETKKPIGKAFNRGDYNTYLSTKYNKTGMALESVDDAVHAAWGGSWRMPTTKEFQYLGKAVSDGKVSSAFTTSEDGVKGLLLTDQADKTKTLFFSCVW